MADGITVTARAVDANMPQLRTDGRTVSPFEFWPTELFYMPVMAYAVYLSIRHWGFGLPSAANPGLPYGGLIGERKSEILGKATGEAAARIPPFITVAVTGETAAETVVADALAALRARGLSLPVVAKPDIGCRGFGVQVIDSRAALCRYVEAFPAGECFLLQQIADLPGEVGAYYVRRPGDKRGRVLALTLKYFPYVIGDGVRSVRQLVKAEPRAGRLFHLYEARLADRLDTVLSPGERLRLAFAGSHSKGTIFKDGSAWITPALERALDDIADGLPGYHVGRFDIRFSDFEEFREGTGDFRLIEANGAGGEPTVIWDSDMRFVEAYRVLFRIVRELWQIGAINRAQGAQMTDAWTLFRLYQAEKRLWRCYPPTH